MSKVTTTTYPSEILLWKTKLPGTFQIFFSKQELNQCHYIFYSCISYMVTLQVTACFQTFQTFPTVGIITLVIIQGFSA